MAWDGRIGGHSSPPNLLRDAGVYCEYDRRSGVTHPDRSPEAASKHDMYHYVQHIPLNCSTDESGARVGPWTVKGATRLCVRTRRVEEDFYVVGASVHAVPPNRPGFRFARPSALVANCFASVRCGYPAISVLRALLSVPERQLKRWLRRRRWRSCWRRKFGFDTKQYFLLCRCVCLDLLKRLQDGLKPVKQGFVIRCSKSDTATGKDDHHRHRQTFHS